MAVVPDLVRVRRVLLRAGRRRGPREGRRRGRDRPVPAELPGPGPPGEVAGGPERPAGGGRRQGRPAAHRVPAGHGGGRLREGGAAAAPAAGRRVRHRHDTVAEGRQVRQGQRRQVPLLGAGPADREGDAGPADRQRADRLRRIGGGGDAPAAGRVRGRAPAAGSLPGDPRPQAGRAARLGAARAGPRRRVVHCGARGAVVRGPPEAGRRGGDAGADRGAAAAPAAAGRVGDRRDRGRAAVRDLLPGRGGGRGPPARRRCGTAAAEPPGPAPRRSRAAVVTLPRRAAPLPPDSRPLPDVAAYDQLLRPAARAERGGAS